MSAVHLSKPGHRIKNALHHCPARPHALIALLQLTTSGCTWCKHQTSKGELKAPPLPGKAPGIALEGFHRRRLRVFLRGKWGEIFPTETLPLPKLDPRDADKRDEHINLADKYGVLRIHSYRAISTQNQAISEQLLFLNAKRQHFGT